MTRTVDHEPEGVTLGRRDFIAGSVAMAGAMIVPRHVLGGSGQAAPSDKLNIAVIGAGGRGADDTEEVAGENIVALCDVDSGHLDEQRQKYPRAAGYADYRVMLEKEDKNIDAVLIATPDHVHAVATMAAMKMGKHVYCEKPLTHTIFEARAIAKATGETRVKTQMGNQGMGFEANRQLKEWLGANVIGRVREVHVWSDRPTRMGTSELWWPQGFSAPQDTPPVPATLNYDLWLGPVSYRPYHPAFSHFVWRGWWDFGTGAMGDLGVHNLAPVFSALKLPPPAVIHASSSPVFPETYPQASLIHYRFPAQGNDAPVQVHWYDGGLLPPRPREFEADRELPRENGILFVGDNGKIFMEGEGGETIRLIPESRMQDFKQPPKALPRSIGHHREWIESCKGNGETESDFLFAGPLTEALLLGNIALRFGGRELHWDAEKMKITNIAEANQFLQVRYRQGWTL